MILAHTDLARYLDYPNACWVQDIEHSRVRWANAAALRLLRIESFDELYARDFTPRSATSRSRLDIYFQRAFAGQPVKTQWTSLSRAGPVSFLADYMAWSMPRAGDNFSLTRATSRIHSAPKACA